MNEEETVTISRRALEAALEHLIYTEDRGPAGEGWQSKELEALIEEIRRALA